MMNKCGVCKVGQLLVGVGAVAWGVVGINPGVLAGGVDGILRILLILVGIAGLMCLICLVKTCPKCETK